MPFAAPRDMNVGGKLRPLSGAQFLVMYARLVSPYLIELSLIFLFLFIIPKLQPGLAGPVRFETSFFEYGKIVGLYADPSGNLVGDQCYRNT